jgi:aminoglycoside phosphotransferase
VTSSQTSAVPFTSQEATTTLHAACRTVGLSARESRLIRLGENALFALPDERVVVRIARGLEVLDDVRKEVAVSAWLNEAGLPAVQTTLHPQPLIVRDKPVTLWHLIPDSGMPATLVELAEVLRVLHHIPVPSWLHLPTLDIFGRVTDRIAKSHAVSDADREFLMERHCELAAAYAELSFPLEPCAVHGDAHSDNLIRATDGTILLLDFERFAFGSPETDLAVTAIEHTLGWGTRAQYDAFADRYGFDVLAWDGFPVLRAVNELKMTTWLMQNVAEDQAIAEEFRNRLACLRSPETPRRWRPF